MDKTEFRHKLMDRGFEHRFELIQPEHNYDYEYYMDGFLVCMIGYITSISYKDEVDLHYHTQDYDRVYDSIMMTIRQVRIKNVLNER